MLNKTPLLIRITQHSSNGSTSEWFQIAYFSWLEFFTDCLVLPFLVKRKIEFYPLPLGFCWVSDWHPMAGEVTFTFDSEEQALGHLTEGDKKRLRHDQIDLYAAGKRSLLGR